MRLALAMAASLLAACSVRTPPPPGADGPTIYALQNCANCHGESGEGKSLGPALAGLGEHWSVEELASFFEDPGPFLVKDARLDELRGAYPVAMSRYDNLEFDERVTLASWLIEEF